MSKDSIPAIEREKEIPSPEQVQINERVLKLEIALEDARKKIQSLGKPVPFWKDRRFLSGLVALPALILSGWVLTAFNKVILKSPYFQPIPFIHTALGTEEAVKAYVAPKKITERGNVVEEIQLLFENNFVSKQSLDEMELVSANDLKGRGFLDRPGLRKAASEGELDNHIRIVGGRRQNFNDFFVQNLGLSSSDVTSADCDNIPIGIEILRLPSIGVGGEICVVVGDAFRFTDEFTVLRPKDVNKIVFELFIIPQKFIGIDEDGLAGEALFINEKIRDEFFSLRVNAKPSQLKRSGVESNLVEGVIAYKFEAEFALDEEMEDRTYDILTVSLNLIEYDKLFGSELRDKSFTVFVVPKFEDV